MLPVIFDTNIYGRITTDPEKAVIVDAVSASPYIFLNFTLIRDELRKTAKDNTYGGGRKPRPALLVTYDKQIGLSISEYSMLSATVRSSRRFARLL